MGIRERLGGHRLSPAGQAWLLRGLAGVGFVFLARTLLDHGIQGAGGGGGIDAIAYWTAGLNVRDGMPLYTIQEGSLAAYAYPPPLAQAMVPFSFLPMPVFVWLWRGIELVSLRIAVRSWTRSGIAILLLPPVVAELDAGNVHLILAATCALAMRGNAFPVGPATLLKFASVPLAPLGWLRDRRGLLLGVATAALIVGASIVLIPTAWTDYLQFLGTAEFPSGWYNIAENVPVPLRLFAAAIAGFAAIRWVRLAPIAVVLAYPVVWFHSLSTLVAVAARLPSHDRRGTP